jgi:PAS domain S-box-containing protein
MSWITVAWSMNAPACLTVAGIYFVVWSKQRDSWVHLLFSCIALSAAAIAALELQLVHAETPKAYGAILRWRQLPVWTLVLSLVGFTRLYLRAGRPWLAWSACGLRTVVLVLNFVFTPNLHYREITTLRQLAWGGEMASVPLGTPNPWSLISEITLLLLLAFFVDASITAWRHGERKRALMVGGNIVFFGTIVAAQVALVVWGVIQVPFFSSFAYLGIVAALGYELSHDMIRAVRLAHELELTEKRLTLTVDSAGVGLWEWDLNKNEIWVTPNRRAQLGLPASGKITFEHLISRWHPDDREQVRLALKEAVENGRDYDVEFRIVLADGSVRWIESRGYVQLNKDGKPRRLLGISMDVTARREARLETQRLRQQRTVLLEREVAERARLEREVIESCAREQRRIAYDLHDGVGQQLVGIALSAKLLEEQLRAERSAEADRASLIAKLANGAARQVRLTARTLEGADGVGDLKTALRSLAANMSENCGVKVTVKADSSSLPISPPVAAQLYRVAQEAMRNAIEHGAAREVLIQLTFGDQDLMLTVQDDGKGFDANVNGRGMGLRIMRYRAQCIGGSCEVHAGPSQGTIVHCRVPLEAQPAVFGLP